MNSDYQVILEEINELKELVKELKKSIDSKDKEIEELKQLILYNKEKEEIKDNELLTLLKEKDPMACYQYVASHKDMDFRKLERIIIDSKNIEANFFFMRNIPNCDFNKHLKVIIDSKDPEYNYYAALSFNLDQDVIEEIRKIVVDSKNIEYIYRFGDDIKNIYKVEDVSGIDISDLEQVIIDSKDLNYYYQFCKDVTNADIELFQDYLLEAAKTDDIKTVFDFGVDVKGSDLERCRNKIIELYNEVNKESQKEIIEVVDKCERNKTKCLFRTSFGDDVIIK